MALKSVNRRSFLKTSGALVAGAAAKGALANESSLKPSSESYIRNFYKSLSSKQKSIICLPFEHPKRGYVDNNWSIVDEDSYSIGKYYTSDQQKALLGALKSALSAKGFRRYERQMKDESDGLGNFTCAIFGSPATENFEWVLTGRHTTFRVDGNAVQEAVFGGPIFYGHAVRFTEKADHKGNVWWYQAKLANALYGSFTAEQKKASLFGRSPKDNSKVVDLKGKEGKFTGIAGKNLSTQQKALLQGTINSLLENYRQSDVNKAKECIDAGGGLDTLHVSFYTHNDLGDDKVWDRWLIEGPGFAWYYRGSPHVHAWVNIGLPKV